MAPKILVIGSINMDLLMLTQRLPHPGESLLSEQYQFGPGGKGANQAVAASLLGGEVTFVCKIGADAFGEQLRQGLERKKVSTEYVCVSESHNSGFAVIIMEADGNNRIIVHPAANFDLNKTDIDRAFNQHYDGLIIQFELAEEIVIYACEQARKRNIPIIVDTGPALDFPLEKIPNIEILSPNETETHTLCGLTPVTDEDCIKAAEILTKRSSAKHIVFKMGEKGAAHYHNGVLTRYPAHKVSVVDVTAAGDVFTAGMAVQYLTDGDMAKAIQYANAAGALAVTKAGAQESVPTAGEVEKMMGEVNLQKQQISERRIGDMIHEKLTGKVQKNALNLFTWLGDDVSLVDKDWCWEAKYKGEDVFYFRIGGFHDEANWLAWSAMDYSDAEIAEPYKKIAWENICTCGNCGSDCKPGRRAVIFGRAFENCCTSSLMFINPEGDGLECLKALINIRKRDITLRYIN